MGQVEQWATARDGAAEEPPRSRFEARTHHLPQSSGSPEGLLVLGLGMRDSIFRDDKKIKLGIWPEI